MDQLHITRRQALKATVAAAGSMTAAAFVPARWTQPVVKSGVLPAHAAASTGNTMAYLLSSTYTPPNNGYLDIVVFHGVIDGSPAFSNINGTCPTYVKGASVTMTVDPAGAITGTPALPVTVKATTKVTVLGCDFYVARFQLGGYNVGNSPFYWVFNSPGCQELRISSTPA
jgi:hypothetical protein